MRQLIIFGVITAILAGLMTACGPSEEEIKQREQARQDSLERVRQQQMQQQRQDSIAQVRQDSIDAAEQQQKKEKEMRSRIQFDENGSFSVQVEAWRSRDKAQAQVGKWKDRGYENAYVVKHGNEKTGDIWFRVRLGKFTTKTMAENFQQVLSEEYGARSWISLTKEQMMEMENTGMDTTKTEQEK